jgi:hypothetical protein
MQRILDCFLSCRMRAMDYITFISMRFYGYTCTLEEVRHRVYRDNQNANRYFNLDNAKDLDLVLALAKDLFKDATDRRSFVTDKTKTLITLNSAILAILVAFLPKVTDFNWGWLKLPFYAGVLFLLNALIMMWVYYDVARETRIRASKSAFNR